MNDSDFTTGQIKPIECYKEGWEIIKNDYWILFLIAFVGALIGGFSLYILLGAMVCGIFYSFLQKIDTGTVSFDNLWKGFDYFVPSLIVTLFIVVPMIVVYAIIYIPFVMIAVMGQKMSSDEMMSMFVGVMAVDAVIILLMVCFHTLLMFSFPLIVDRKMSALQAMKTSIKAVWKNLSGVAGLIGVQFVLIIIASLITCGIGTYFLMPIMVAGMAVGYRKVFPQTQNFNAPPPPNLYQDAGIYN